MKNSERFVKYRLPDWSALFQRSASSVSEKIKILSGQEDAKLLAQILMECGEKLVSSGDKLPSWIEKYGGNFSLSEVLVKEGYFPLYGMPERSVSLLTSDPNNRPNKREWPISEGSSHATKTSR